MKILVDEMPANPTECRHSEMIPNARLTYDKDGKVTDGDCKWIYKCGLTKNHNSSFECKIGTEGFECPFYRPVLRDS